MLILWRSPKRVVSAPGGHISQAELDDTAGERGLHVRLQFHLRNVLQLRLGVGGKRTNASLPEHYDAAMNPARGKSKLLGFTVGPGKLAWNPLCPYAYEISFSCPWNFENVPSGSVILVMIVLFL